MVSGKTREELGELTKTREVELIVEDDGAYGTMGTRIAREDEDGQEWVKVNGKYWRYPQEVER